MHFPTKRRYMAVASENWERTELATISLRTALGPVADEVTGSTWTDSILVPGAERVAVIRGPADGSPGTAATVTWLHADQVGTTRVLTDASGNNLVQCNQNSYYAQGSLLTYAPFGAELDCAQSQTEYKFTGKPRDEESGLDDFGARYHNSTLGRWLTPDPTGGQLVSPQSLNKYAYVMDNPVSYTDPPARTPALTTATNVEPNWIKPLKQRGRMISNPRIPMWFGRPKHTGIQRKTTT